MMIRRVRAIISVALAIVSILITLLSCINSVNKPSVKQAQIQSSYEKSPFSSFRDVPGVTEEEIKAIETFQRENRVFSYGALPSTEAFIKDNGEMGGFTPLFCEWLTELFGIPFKTRFINYSEVFAIVLEQRVDFTGDLKTSAERKQEYIMSEPIAMRSLISVRHKGSLSIDEIKKTRLPRYAFFPGSVAINDVASISNFGAYETVETDIMGTVDDLYQMLKNGEIDSYIVVCSSELYFDQYDDVYVEDFLPYVVNPVSISTGNPELMPIISVVDKMLANGAIHYLNRQYIRGQQEYREQKFFLQLSDEEKAFLRNTSAVQVAAEYWFYPVSYFNPYNGKWEGIAFDIFDEVEKMTGLTFEVANDKNAGWEELLEMLQDGRADMICDLMQTPARIGKYIWPKTMYKSDTYALISKQDTPSVGFVEIPYARVGLMRGIGNTEMFNSWFPNASNTIMYDTTDELCDSLDSGEIEFAMLSTGILTEMTHYHELSGYKANYMFSDYEYTFGFNKEQSILCSIIDKALLSIDTARITKQWDSRTYDYRAQILKSQRPWLIGVSFLLVLILALVTILFARSRYVGKRLQNTLAQFETMWQSVESGMAVVDAETRAILNVNPAAVRMYGSAKDAIIGMQYDKLFYADNYTPIFNDSLTVYRAEQKFVNAAGDIIPTIRSASKILYNGRPAVLENFTDISYLQKAEEAKKASVAKSLFLANMSHEIRTPMNSIMGFAELAQDGENPPKTRDYLDKIMKNAAWLLQIINDVLDISKIEAGKMELENIPFDMHELFASCRTLIMPRAVEKGLLLHFYAEPSIGKKPLGDPTRLRQVLLNLLSNAIKFTNTGTVKVSSAIENISNKTVTMSFAIVDSGIGMTSEQITRIFDPFVQADDTTTRKFGGTGLGLSITKNIVEMMGGRLFVESMPMVGSKFSFDLTFDTIDVTEDDLLDKKIVFDNMERPNFEGEILLCEDNVMNQQMICEHLARVGLKTVVAENGKIGVDMVESRIRKGEKQFDLIFMDMHMPVMDGLEAASRILGMHTGIPMIALTANVMSNDIEVYRKNGMNDCVGKPFTSQELWRCLMKYIKPVRWQTVDDAQSALSESNLRQKLVANFVKSNQNRISEIKDALKMEDTGLALRLAHTLKGNAAQLGKILLQKAAAEIEQQLKGGNRVTAQQISVLETEFSAALTELTALFEQFSRLGETVQTGFLDPEAMQDLFEKLEPLLDSGDPESLKFIGALSCVPGSEKLIAQMEDLDFHAAIKTFAQIKENGVK